VVKDQITCLKTGEQKAEGSSKMLRQQTISSATFPSSLRGLVQSLMNVCSANSYCIPEAISSQLFNLESFSKAELTKNRKVNTTRGCNPLEPQLVVKIEKLFHYKLSEERLLRRESSSISTPTSLTVSHHSSQ
jgi:hypothetical protein